LHLHGTLIEDTYAEAFRMWASRVIVTAADERWLRTAAQVVTGYATSVIACDTEAGVERWLPRAETLDDRPGVALLFFALSVEGLTTAVPKRVGQCLMTCPTTAVYDGLPEVSDRVPVGQQLRYFGDGRQKSKRIAGRRYWRIPIMAGEFLCEEAVGAVKAVAGGNFLIQGVDQHSALRAAERAVAALESMPDVITPFPGGVVASGSRVGSRYPGLRVSSNHEFCPTLRSQSSTLVHPGVGCVLEIVINGLSEEAVRRAMREGIAAACGSGVVAISAGNYGGKLGKFHFPLRPLFQKEA
jgi:formylmethanofuran--tetrahydromethanopterin N-formyltransferase